MPASIPAVSGDSTTAARRFHGGSEAVLPISSESRRWLVGDRRCYPFQHLFNFAEHLFNFAEHLFHFAEKRNFEMEKMLCEMEKMLCEMEKILCEIAFLLRNAFFLRNEITIMPFRRAPSAKLSFLCEMDGYFRNPFSRYSLFEIGPLEKLHPSADETSDSPDDARHAPATPTIPPTAPQPRASAAASLEHRLSPISRFLPPPIRCPPLLTRPPDRTLLPCLHAVADVEAISTVRRLFKHHHRSNPKGSILSFHFRLLFASISF
ncbi:hypothetical protein LXL04_016717 [Taraxacum kok-saghyz]